MKKFVLCAALAVAMTAIMAHDASAWINSKFGVGLNLCWQSGGNNLLGGLFQNGQPPAPDCCIGGTPGFVPGPAPCPGPVPCPNGGHGPFHGQLSTPDAAAATAVGRTLPQNRMYNNYGQAVNYQYYNYYYGYGR